MLVAERLGIVEKERTPMTISRTPPLPTKYIRCPIGTADIFLWLNVKCWGADYKISQYNIFGYQNLSVSRSIKVYVF